MSNNMIIILGIAGAIMLLGGVGFSAYTRIKKIVRSGMRLSDLLDNLEESLEDDESLRYRKKSTSKKDEAAAPKGDNTDKAKENIEEKEESTKEE